MKNLKDKRSPLSPTVVRLGLISLFADIASEMLYPITPIFLTSVIGASMTALGLIEGVAEAIASLLKTYSGFWSDKLIQRKPFILIGYLLGALSKPLTGIAGAWSTVLVARGIDRTGKGLRTAPRDAMIADSVEASQRGAAFGWHRGADTLGAAIGPLIAVFYLSYFPNNLRGIYFWAFIPGVIAVLIALSLRERKHTASEAKSSKIHFSLKHFSPTFKKYVIAWTLFAVTNSSDVFLIMKAKDSGLSLTHVILLYCFYNLTYSLLSPFFGRLSDRMGRKKLLIMGLLLFASAYFGFVWANSTWQFWLLFGVYGTYMAMTEGNGKALAVDLMDSKVRATGLGVLGTFTGFATIVASTIAGLLWDNFGAQWTFIYGAVGAVLAVILLSTDRTKSAAT